MRGIAALTVVFYHYCAAYCGTSTEGYLAVDFFFALSGLVIGRNYEETIRTGMTNVDFIIKRLIRLWPLYFIGLGLAVLRVAAQIVLHDPNSITPGALGRDFLFEFFMLPPLPARGELFPLNGPAWSLFFELVINIAFAVWVFRSNKMLPIVLAVVSALVLGYAIFVHGTVDLGWTWQTFLIGLARVSFSFSVGVILNRILPLKTAATWLALVPVLLIGAVLVYAPPFGLRVYTDVGFTLVVSPLLVAVGAICQAPKPVRWAFERLGDISYPVYVMHLPLIFIWMFIARKLHLPAPLVLPAFMVGLCVLALFSANYIDAPVRGALSRLWRNSKLGSRNSRV